MNEGGGEKKEKTYTHRRERQPWPKQVKEAAQRTGTHVRTSTCLCLRLCVLGMCGDSGGGGGVRQRRCYNSSSRQKIEKEGEDKQEQHALQMSRGEGRKHARRNV